MLRVASVALSAVLLSSCSNSPGRWVISGPSCGTASFASSLPFSGRRILDFEFRRTPNEPGKLLVRGHELDGGNLYWKMEVARPSALKSSSEAEWFAGEPAPLTVDRFDAELPLTKKAVLFEGREFAYSGWTLRNFAISPGKQWICLHSVEENGFTSSATQEGSRRLEVYGLSTGRNVLSLTRGLEDSASNIDVAWLDDRYLIIRDYDRDRCTICDMSKVVR